MAELDVNDILKEIDTEELFTAWPEDASAATEGMESSLKMAETCHKHVMHVLNNVTEGFSFYQAAKALRDNPDKVSRFTSQLIPLLTSCVVTRSTVKGVNREASQSAFFKLMASGVPQLTALSGHHQLTMWVCNNVFADFTTTPHPASTDSCCSTTPISPEEADIAHYIGGFVVSKLKQRSSASDYLQVLDTFVSTMEPAHGTLLGAKSRGRLTNLTKDAQSIFVELEQAFCALFPSEAVQIDVGQYKAACMKNQVVQDCYHSATDHLDQQNKGKILLDVICLYFKVRVHHKCKVLIERARSQKRTAKQDRALRSKLAK